MRHGMVASVPHRMKFMLEMSEASEKSWSFGLLEVCLLVTTLVDL